MSTFNNTEYLQLFINSSKEKNSVEKIEGCIVDYIKMKKKLSISKIEILKMIKNKLNINNESLVKDAINNLIDKRIIEKRQCDPALKDFRTAWYKILDLNYNF